MHHSNEGQKQDDVLQIQPIVHRDSDPEPQIAPPPPSSPTSSSSARKKRSRKHDGKPNVPVESLLQTDQQQHPRTQSMAVVVTKDGRTYSTSSYGAVGM